MLYQKDLDRVSAEFLQNTNRLYDECSNGIVALDKILVSVSSTLTPTTRVYVVPILYAYWERYFRIIFTEFLRCISLSGINSSHFNTKLFLYRFRKEIQEYSDLKKVKFIHDISSGSQTEVRNLLQEFSGWLDKPITFSDPSAHVNTESNVEFNVLKNNCERFGIDIERIKTAMESSQEILYVGLKSLIAARNSIAHGESFEPIGSEVWEKHKNFVYVLMNVLQLELYSFLQDGNQMLSPEALSAVAGQSLATNTQKQP